MCVHSELWFSPAYGCAVSSIAGSYLCAQTFVTCSALAMQIVMCQMRRKGSLFIKGHISYYRNQCDEITQMSMVREGTVNTKLKKELLMKWHLHHIYPLHKHTQSTVKHRQLRTHTKEFEKSVKQLHILWVQVLKWTEASNCSSAPL